MVLTLGPMPLGDAVFYGIAFLAVVSSILVVTLDQLFHSAVFLALAFLAFGMLYIQLGANLVGVIQVLIYACAVTMLLMFVIMLTKSQTDSGSLGQRAGLFASLQDFAWHKGIALLIAVALLGIMLGVFLGVPGTLPAATWRLAVQPDTSVLKLADLLLGQFVAPFEMASVLLLAALIGAVVLARTDDAPKETPAEEAARKAEARP